MADTLTTFLSLVKQTIGGNRNTWGTILNANMDLIDAAVAGKFSKAVTGGSYTLLDTEWINRILAFSGALVSDQAIVVPNESGTWLVYNGTSGSNTLSFKTASGSAVALAQGAWATMWCDGNDVVRIGPSSLLFSSQFQAPSGTVSLPGNSWASDTDTGRRLASYASGTLSSNPFATSNGSPTVTVAHTAHGMASNDYAFYSGATAVAGITIDGLYPVTVVNANSYTITHSANANAGASGGGTPAYKYMKAAAGGNAETVVANGADVAHFSPYGLILTGAAYITGALRAAGNAIVGGTLSVTGAATITGALNGAAATFTGLLTGVTATLSDILTLSSTSHMFMAGGTTAQRPGSPTGKEARVNTDNNTIEAYLNGSWRVFEVGRLPRGYIDGCVLSNNASDAVNDIDISAGVCRDSTDTINIVIAASTKQLDANWAAGTTGGGRNSAAGIANSTYHVYAAAKADGTSGIYFHTSTVIATVLAALQAETGGASYLYLRRLGSIVRSGGNILPFTQLGDYFEWTTLIQDVSDTNPGTSALTKTLTVPTGLALQAVVNATLGIGGSATNLLLTALSATDQTPSATNATIATPFTVAAAAGVILLTNTSGQIRSRVNVSDGGVVVTVRTRGYYDQRGKNA